MIAIMTKKPAFGDRLRQLRQEKGLTLAALADLAGVNIQSVHRIEAGERPNPGWDTVVALAEALGVTPDAFLKTDEPAVPAETRPASTRPLGKRK